MQATMLEEQNDDRLQGLTDRVAVLKSITIGIGNEVVEGTKDLNSLGDAMSNARDFLGGTVKRMNNMARRQGGWFCNMMLFLLFVCWLFVSRLPSSVRRTQQQLTYITHSTGVPMVVETISNSHAFNSAQSPHTCLYPRPRL